MAEAPINYLGDVQRLSLRQNDVVVLSVDKELSGKHIESLRSALTNLLPMGNQVVVLGKGMKLGVLAIEEAALVADSTAADADGMDGVEGAAGEEVSSAAGGPTVRDSRFGPY